MIGAGLPRTATMSLQQALTELYEGKCYHMTDVLQGSQEDIDVWVDGMDGKMSQERWQQYFQSRNYVTGVDFPLARFYKELMVAFPNAKVVLSTRDPSTWYGSVHGSIYQLTKLITENWSYSLLNNIMDGRKNAGKLFFQKIDSKPAPGCDMALYEAIKAGPEISQKFFRDWEEEVKRSVPADRLLVHSAKQGWEPLCKFLGRPIPDSPYPRANDTASIQKAMRAFKILHGVVFYLMPVATAVTGYLCRDSLSAAAVSISQLVANIWGPAELQE